ncbi:MAG: hypothetical protein HXX18_13390 [Bacteroidetes bacterium]|nr:hypothetical protein [Bacteroidota bacterium]
MQDLSILVSGIEFKLRKLIEQNNQLKIENAQLLKTQEELNNLIENQKIIINKSQEKYKVLKIAKSLESSTNSFDQKIKINEILREVDKCIGLLNK